MHIGYLKYLEHHVELDIILPYFVVVDLCYVFPFPASISPPVLPALPPMSACPSPLSSQDLPPAFISGFLDFELLL